MKKRDWLVWLTDRTDGTKWNVTVYAETAIEARDMVSEHKPPEVTIERVVEK